MCCSHNPEDFSRIHGLLRRKSRHEGVFYKNITPYFKTSGKDSNTRMPSNPLRCARR